MSLGALAVLAQDDTAPDDTPAPKSMPFGHGGFHGRFHDGFRGYGDANDEALAEALGITVEQLQAARQKVAADRLAQAVEDGLITQDQANLMLATAALKGYLDHEAIMAQALGVTPEELAAARESGELRELLGGITPADLQANMQEALEASVNQAVADNVITQNQADLVLQQMANGIGRGGFGGPHSFGGGRGDFHHFQQQAPQPDGGVFAPFRGFQSSGA
jgi:hypothetical protein